MKSSKKKKLLVILISIVSVIVVIGGAIAAIHFIKESKKDSNPVEVVNVSMFSGGWYEEGNTISGSIDVNSQQNIYPNATSQVKEIFVKEGDVIKVGEPLVQYDVTANSLALETERTSLELLKSQVTKAEKKLEQLKKVIPVEDLPPAPTPEPVETPTDAIPEAPGDNGENQGKEKDTYTKEELKKAISEKEKEIRDLKLQVDMASLKYQMSLKSADNGTVNSTSSGVVQKVNDYEEALASGEPFIVIGGNTGYTLKGQVSEWQKAEIELGMSAIVNCYDNGMTYDGIVTEVSDIPEEGSYGQGTATYYPVSIAIESEEEIPQFAWADVSFAQEETSSNQIVIPKAYVREENGQKYVLIAVDGRLKKQNVKTGKIYWGTEIEIISGLTVDDQIAFPYGKDAVEGKVVTEASDGFFY